MSEAIGIVVGALIGAVSALITTRFTAKRQADDLFLKALAFLGGGTQNRNLGLSAIELYWDEYPQHKVLCTSMLIGSAIYLLSGSDQEDAAHEIYNLNQTMQLLLDGKLPYDSALKSNYGCLLEALHKRKGVEKPGKKSGLWLDKDITSEWHDKLSKYIAGG